MTSTTSGIALTDVLTDALIVAIVWLASLVTTELLFSLKGRSKKASGAVLGINVTLLIIFCALVAFNVAQRV
jgi:hypothetical protein